MACTGVYQNKNKNIFKKKRFIWRKEDNSLAKKSHWKSSSGTLWSAPFILGLFFSNQKGLFYFQLKVVGGTAYDLKVLDISDTFLTINMVKNCRIAFIVPIIGVFIVRFERDSKVFKDSDQIMASRFTNVDSLAAIARVFI